MTYPIPNYTRVWVRGRIIDLGKAALQEDNYGLALPVTFSPSPKVLLNAGTGQIISTASFKITPAAQDGYFAIQLPATDDPDINPTNFTYSVKEPTGRSYNIVVPAATPVLNSPGDPLHGQPVLDLITVVPSPPAGAGSVQLLTGLPGRGIASIDNVVGDMVVTYTDSTTQNLGPVAGATKLADLTDVTTTSAKVGRLVAVSAASGGAPTGFSLDDWSSVRRGIASQGLVVDDMTDTGAWTMTSGTGSVVVAGGELTVTTTSAATVTAKRDLSLSLAGGRFLSFEIMRDANLETFDVTVSVTSDASTRVWRVNEAVPQIPVGSWYRYTLPMSQSVAVGGALPAELRDVRALRFVANPLAAVDTVLKIRNIRLHENPIGPSIIWQFDDGRADTYTQAFPILTANGYTGNIPVEYTAVDTAGRCTQAQLNEMYAAGWSMNGHHTTQITDLSDADALLVFKASKAYLAAQGFTRGADHWVWPGGARDTAKEAIAARLWTTMRKVTSHHNIAVPYVVHRTDPSISYVQTNTSLATLQARIDTVAERGGVLILVFHSIVDTKVAQEDWLISDFSALAAYARNKGLRDTNYDAVFGGLGPNAFSVA